MPIAPISMTICTYSPNCSGCSSWGTPYSDQIASKINRLRTLLQEKNLEFETEIQFLSCGEDSLRNRVDFTLEFDEQLGRHTMGFYDVNKKLMQIDQCLQLNPSLQQAYTEFSNFKFFYGGTPVRKGSVRLRVGPNGIKGCWLDFSNMDIKHLLEDQKVLNKILDAGFIVEIGQKGKQLVRENTTLKLKDPVAYNWMKTPDQNGLDLQLKCLISDFTQPSWISGGAMVSQVLRWTSEIQNVRSLLEFGPGIGQFTLGFLKSGLNVAAFEVNKSAAENLLANANSHGLAKNLKVAVGDFHKLQIPPSADLQMIFVNPARSGLKIFVGEISKVNPEYVIYVSCFPESMTDDLAKLKNSFNLRNIIIIDQFPQTKHFEVCILLKNYTKE